MFLAKYVFFASFLLVNISAIAQSNILGIGAGGGAMQSYGDADNSLNFQPALQVQLDIKLSKRFSLLTEFHASKLVNGNYDISSVTQPFYARYFVTNISGVSTAVTFYVFSFDKNAKSWQQALKSLYAGFGVGLEHVNVLSIRTKATLANGDKYLFRAIGSPDLQLSIPVIAGFNYYLPQSPLAIGLRAQLGIVPQDELEGYYTNINGKPDLYGLGTISLKYYFQKSSQFNSNKGF